MSTIITFGFGGYCENCDDTHDHPPHNIISVVELDETESESNQE